MIIPTNGIKLATNKAVRDLAHQSPTILTIVGIAGIVTTVVLAVRATPKAIELLELEKKLSNADLTTIDVVKTTWKEYVPTVLMGAATITCFIGANSIHWRRAAAMQGAYSLTAMAFKEYQHKVVELLGTKKEQGVQESIAEDKLLKDPVSQNTIFISGMGETLCYDALSGRYFKGDIEKLRRLENKVNHLLISDMWVTLNEVYSEMGLDDIDLGEQLGWHVDEMLEFIFTSKLTDTGEPCLVLTHRNLPVIYTAFR